MLETKGRTILVWFCVHFENCLGGGVKLLLYHASAVPFVKKRTVLCCNSDFDVF